MTNDRKARDKATNAHFMAVLKGAIGEADKTYSEVDALIGVAEGTTGRWIRNVQVMRAPTFVAICLAVGADPEELMARAMKRIKAAGLLDDVAVLPGVDAEQSSK